MALTPEQLQRAASLVGTPLYAYSAPALRARVAALQAALSQADFVYSLKANTNLSIIRCLAEAGAGTEVCSLFELETSLIAAVSAARTIFVGPAKSREETDRAISVGIKAIIAESLEELMLHDRIAAERGYVQPVALRINPGFHVPGAKLPMSGKPTQFGLDETLLPEALALWQSLPRTRLAGLHVYMVTRILDARVIVANTRRILALAEEIIARTGHSLDLVDIGGGFGVPYSNDEELLCCEPAGKRVKMVANESAAGRDIAKRLELRANDVQRVLRI